MTLYRLVDNDTFCETRKSKTDSQQNQIKCEVVHKFNLDFDARFFPFSRLKKCSYVYKIYVCFFVFF